MAGPGYDIDTGKKRPGWFSHRHQDDTAHQQEALRKEAKLANKKIIEEQNKVTRSHRSPKQQLDLLDKRLGQGVGAKKEREKLQKLIESTQKSSS